MKKIMNVTFISYLVLKLKNNLPLHYVLRGQVFHLAPTQEESRVKAEKLRPR